MIEITKTFLFSVALGAGTTMLVCLFISGIIRCFCIMLDHLKVANVIRESVQLYIKTKRPDIKIKEEDIKFKQN